MTIALFTSSVTVLAQEKKDFDSIPFIQELNTLTEENTLDFELEPISKAEFLAISQNRAPSFEVTPDKTIVSGDTTIVKTKNAVYEFHENENLSLPYYYTGFIPHIQCHMISYCKEICEDFLLDDFTDEKMFIPTSYDQGVLGMPFSPEGSMWLVYSSYDGPDYDHFYYYRAEAYFYKVEKNKGLGGLHFYGSFHTNNWSIEEMRWIDENSIALKLYSSSRWGDGSGVDYSYFKTRIN